MAVCWQMELGQFSAYTENRFSTLIVQAALALDEKYGAVTGKVLRALCDEDGDVVEVTAAVANLKKKPPALTCLPRWVGGRAVCATHYPSPLEWERCSRTRA